ncbi:uracil-DNA glycosylase family protein [Pseudomonas sp. P8_241]|uniref:uracil-DNA glycosylase family protein n=1 Tax=Pseudomonas sp. P8_241 TaxID=3043445 RepID=UPI002A35E3C5|nr:uracil-DNA glycosylase family protein [Pseudomonas sp. P8_241]WPN49109.1 uracil-DNA glycosylase family protein [Pseudomonas sp. P8_241]
MSVTRYIDLYSKIVECPLSCKGITNSPERGIIPRSFYVSENSVVSMLIIGKNPGKAPEWENDLYKNKSTSEAVKEHLHVVRDLFEEKLNVASNFHKNLISRVAFILDVPATPSDVFRHAALSALVKCQSEESKQAPLPAITMHTCFHKHLKLEIELYRPQYLLALGGEVFRYLSRPEIRTLHQLPVGELWHPSWSNMPGGEENYRNTKLTQLREQYKIAIIN